MKVPVHKIESAAADGWSRYVCNAVYLDVENKVAVATDGHQISVIPCEPESGDASGIISRAALKRAREMERRVPKKERKGAVSIRVGRKETIRCVKNDETVVLPRTIGQFPDWRKVIPEVSGTPTFVLDFAVLEKAVAAIRDNGDPRGGYLAMWISAPEEPMVIAACTHEMDRAAVVMPLRNYQHLKGEDLPISKLRKGCE